MVTERKKAMLLNQHTIAPEDRRLAEDQTDRNKQVMSDIGRKINDKWRGRGERLREEG